MDLPGFSVLLINKFVQTSKGRDDDRIARRDSSDLIAGCLLQIVCRYIADYWQAICRLFASWYPFSCNFRVKKRGTDGPTDQLIDRWMD